MGEANNKHIKSFKTYCQKILPAVYDDSISYYELLCKVMDKLNETIAAINENSDSIEENNESIEALKVELNDLLAEFEKVKNGDYVTLYLESIIKWIDCNLQQLVARTVKFICFASTEDGRLTAYIPASWKFLSFDTDIDPDKCDYGRLKISW